MAIQEVTVISVPVSDQERSKKFYVETMGFDLARDDDSIPGIRWVEVVPHGAGTALTLVNWFDTMPAGSLRGLVFGCDDLERQCEQLRAQGVEFERALERQPWGEEAVIRDPDGNQLVLQQA